jgi:hypothetical protein
MSRKLTRIKEELKEAGMTTTGHVIMLIIRSQYLLMKIIFLLAWLIGFGITLYLVTNNILDYYKYDVTTQTRVIREQPMIFPKVTICNADHFVTDDSISFLANVLRNDEKFFAKINEATAAGATTDLTLVNWFISNDVYFESQALYAAYSADNKTRMSLGYDKDTFIRACYFNTDYCELYDNFIEQIYDIKFGNCFTFNGQTKSKLLTSGILI